MALHDGFESDSTTSLTHAVDSRIEGGRTMHVHDYRAGNRVIVRKVLIDGCFGTPGASVTHVRSTTTRRDPMRAG